MQAQLPAFPLVGRSEELRLIRGALDAAARGRGSTIILTATGGVGKTRLTHAAIEEARAQSWSVAVGRSNPVERGVPYSLFSDALLPMLRHMDPDLRRVLTRGVSELAYLFPLLDEVDVSRAATDWQDPQDFKNRLLWHFTEFLRRLTARTPLLIVLEDLQWADASSVELLHFVARQTAGERLVLLCTHNPDAHEAAPVMRTLEQSLVSLGVARVHSLQPLDFDATAELISSAFGVEDSVTRGFTALLYGWTRGNPFFVEETLKALLSSGALYERDGRWLGWDLNKLELPRSIRDAVIARLAGLSPPARTMAEYASVTGTRVMGRVLAATAPLPEAERVDAIEELRRHQVLLETLEGDEIVYEFTHPIIRETLYLELGLTRARVLHAVIADALEGVLGASADAHADVLAYHYARARTSDTAGKAIRYLAEAGRRALAKNANQEAADYFTAALDQNEAAGRPAGDAQEAYIAESLARACQRLGEYERAFELLERARTLAVATNDANLQAGVLRRIGLARFWTGKMKEALASYDEGLQIADAAGDIELGVKLRIARGICLQEAGRPAEAKEEVLAALQRLEGIDEPALLARAHRSLMQLHVWSGPPDVAREHGARAIELAERSGDQRLAYSAHWAMAVLEGLTGHFDGVEKHLAAAERIAQDLRSPLLEAWVAELAIEVDFARGEWDAAINRGEHAIAIARALKQNMLLPRLLVWTALVYLARDDISRGKAYVDEAWQLSGADNPRAPASLHAVVPAHVGRMGYNLARGQYEEAARLGEAALALVDKSGYAVWAIHHVLPFMAETYLWRRDHEGAHRIGARLRAESERFGHVLGLAWADGCDAAAVWLSGDSEGGAVLLRRAAEQLERVPYVWDAARLRRQLAGRLADTGDREGAARELRQVHEVFMRLGAVRELEKARAQFREIGHRPPARATVRGTEALTERELEIVRRVADRMSNKAIGKELGISPRTVSTHLSHIFEKLEIGSRKELAETGRRYRWGAT